MKTDKPRKNPLVMFIHKMGSPPWFYNFTGKFVPWLWAVFITLTVWGLYLGLFKAPPDYLQGESFRILYIHVPAAWMSLMIYVLMAIMAFIALVWRIRIMEIMAMSSAPIGAAFTLVTLVAGSLWGRPTWGTYWVWDARLTSELVLLFLYLGVIGLYKAIDEPRKAARAASLLIAGWRGQSAHHPLFRQVVEYPSPGQQHQCDRQQHRPQYVVAITDHAHRDEVLLRRQPDHPFACHAAGAGPA